MHVLNHRDRLDELERAWWEEEAELSAGPAEQGQGGRYTDRADEGGPTSWQARHCKSYEGFFCRCGFGVHTG